MGSSADIITATEAIVGIVHEIPEAACAQMDLVPEYDISQVKDLRIVVTPQSSICGNSGMADRSSPARSVKVNIAIMQRLPGKDSIPEMLSFTESIAMNLERRRIDNGYITVVECDPIYDAVVFRQSKIFIAILTVTVKVMG